VPLHVTRRIFADLKIGRYGDANGRAKAGPFGRTQGKPFDQSQDEQNCYNRAQMAGADEAR
jgi:hypothetical protein